MGIPARGWMLDFNYSINKMRNLVDHEVLGNSSLLFPLTIDNGRVHAFESTLRSPLILHRAHVHYAFSYMVAQGRGGITGGLTDFSPPPEGFFYLDHDQRVTIAAGSEVTLPKRMWTSFNIVYGSGFLRGDGPDHMPQHATLDLALGKDINANVSLRLTALNALDAQFLTGLDNSFAGTHYAAPREVAVQVSYRFQR
jgi:hypothetical protein